MVNLDGAKVEAQSTRGTEDSRAEGASVSDGQEGASSLGEAVQHLSERVFGAAWPGAIASIGGIVARMIADKQERIREVEACIVWYQEELEKRMAELEDLNQFSQQLFSQAESESESA